MTWFREVEPLCDGGAGGAGGAGGVLSPGKLMGRSDGLTELLHIPNSAKVVNLKDPLPGMWSIKVT